VTAKSPAYHDHPLQRLLLNLPDATPAKAAANNTNNLFSARLSHLMSNIFKDFGSQKDLRSNEA
jgi:hypothetical protein